MTSPLTTHRELQFGISLNIESNFDRNHTFYIDVESNKILFGAKSIVKVELQ